MLTAIEVTSQWRSEVLAATSRDRQWEYRQVSGPHYAVTHVPSGRRYWVTGLDRARTETADGTAAGRLWLGHEPPAGKPMVKGEYRAIVDELPVRDLERMLELVLREEGVPELVAGVRARIGLSPSWEMSSLSVGKVLGAVYGAVPGVWLDALRQVRPDLVPPHLEKKVDASECTCVYTCAEDPATACSLSGQWHVHPDNGLGIFGPCPEHPDAPGDL